MYTEEEIDEMPIEDLEHLAEMLDSDECEEWAYNGYSGQSYIAILAKRNN